MGGHWKTSDLRISIVRLGYEVRLGVACLGSSTATALPKLALGVRTAVEVVVMACRGEGRSDMVSLIADARKQQCHVLWNLYTSLLLF